MVVVAVVMVLPCNTNTHTHTLAVLIDRHLLCHSVCLFADALVLFSEVFQI